MGRWALTLLAALFLFGAITSATTADAGRRRVDFPDDGDISWDTIQKRVDARHAAEARAAKKKASRPASSTKASKLGAASSSTGARGRSGASHASSPSLWDQLNPFSAYNGKKATIRANRRDGKDREDRAWLRLRVMYPFADIKDQPVLVTADGKPALDPLTGQSRRFDFAVFGMFGLRLVEVKPASQAGFQEQMRKAERILAHHRRVYIRDASGELYRVTSGHLPDEPLVLR